MGRSISQVVRLISQYCSLASHQSRYCSVLLCPFVWTLSTTDLQFATVHFVPLLMKRALELCFGSVRIFRRQSFRSPARQSRCKITLCIFCSTCFCSVRNMTERWCAQAPSPHPAAARYLYGLEECTLVGSFGPCPASIDCGITYEVLSGGGIALTYRYDDRITSDEDTRDSDVRRRRLQSTTGKISVTTQGTPHSYASAPRRLDELPTGRPDGCASSLRLELRPGRKMVMVRALHSCSLCTSLVSIFNKRFVPVTVS